jgi:hypothetical protein
VEHTASILLDFFEYGDGKSRFLRNADEHLADYTVSCPGRQYYSSQDYFSLKASVGLA